MSNTNPVALVVGAGDFIGSAIAKRFARGGYTLCVGRRNADKLKTLVDAIESDGGKAVPFTLDARKEERIEEVFRTIENEVGPLEVVVFNPGGNVNFPITETTSRVFYKVWEMACFGGFLTGREAAKYMVPRGKGSIFFTGATASVRGGSGFAAFASAKFGLRALAQSMARELGPKNIHVAHLIHRRRRGHSLGAGDAQEVARSGRVRPATRHPDEARLRGRSLLADAQPAA